MVDSINVGKIFIGSRLVGGMLFNSVTKVTSFEYDPKWIKEGFSISPLKLPLTDEIFSFPHLSWDTYKGLPSALADTLPDDFGNAIINAWLVRNGRPLDEFSPLERLLYAGSRGMGTLEYKPSIVKARPKAVIGINKKRDRILSGQRPLPTGFEHFLIKFDGVRERSSRYEVFGDPQGYGRIEYAYYLAAIDAGIFMMHSELLEEGGRAHFITKRFDRISNEKVHYQSLCAIDHADFKKAGQYSYEQIFDVMRRLTLPLADADQMMRRMIFNVLARNHDDHTKNFGFVYQEGQWALSPAFDIAYSYRPGSPWVERHQLTINGKRDDFSYADFEAALSHSSTLLGMLPKIFDEVKHSVLNLKEKMVMAGVPQKQQVALIKTFRLGIER